MKYAKTAANDGRLRKLVGEAHSRIDIVVVADIGLVLETKSERQVEFLADFEIVLNKAGELKLIDVEPGIAKGPCELCRSRGRAVSTSKTGDAQVIVQA